MNFSEPFMKCFYWRYRHSKQSVEPIQKNILAP